MAIPNPRLVRATAANNWVLREYRQRDGSAHLDRTPMGTGLIKAPTKSADGSETKGLGWASTEGWSPRRPLTIYAFSWKLLCSLFILITKFFQLRTLIIGPNELL